MLYRVLNRKLIYTKHAVLIPTGNDIISIPGVILKEDEVDKWQIVSRVLTSGQNSGGNGNADIQVIKETVDIEDTINYHRACK